MNHLIKVKRYIGENLITIKKNNYANDEFI